MRRQDLARPGGRGRGDLGVDDLAVAIGQHRATQREIVEAGVDRGADAHLRDRRAGDLLDRHDVVGVVGLCDQRAELAEVDLDPLVIAGAVVGRELREVVLALLAGEPVARLLIDGNTPAVAPRSAIMLAIVARSGSDRSAVPGPVNSNTLFLPPLAVSRRSSSRMMSLAWTHGR